MASHSPSTPRRPSSYFATMHNQLPFLACKVKSPGGPDKFIAPDESHLFNLPELYRRQPALFQPRDQWGTTSAPNPAKDDTSDVIMRKLADHQRSCFPPPQGWDIRWGEHACRLWQLWLDIDEETMLSSTSVVELLPLLSYGLEDIICLARREIIIYDPVVKPNAQFGPSPDTSFKGKSPYLDDIHDKVSCDAKLGFSTPLDFRRAMHGKRFLAGIVYFRKVKHFTTYIFDRLRKCIYHFDTLGDLPYARPGADQVGRARCVAVAMREALIWAGQPFHVDFFAVPVSQQPTGWECGILSVFCLFLTLRGLVGNGYMDMCDRYRQRPITIEGCDTHGIASTPDLPVRDWILDEGGDPDLSRDRISAWFQRVIMDELGVPGASCLVEGRDPSSVYFGRHAGLIQRQGGNLSRSQLPIPQLYTSLGGFQPIAFNNMQLVQAWPHDRLLALPATHGSGAYRTRRAASSERVFVPPRLSDSVKAWYSSHGIRVEDNMPQPPRLPADHVELAESEGSRATSKSATPSKTTPPSKPAPPSKTAPPSTPRRPGIGRTPRGDPATPVTPASRVSVQPSPAPTPSLGLGRLLIDKPETPASVRGSASSKSARAPASPAPGPSARDHPLPVPKVFKTRLVVEVPGGYGLRRLAADD